MALNLRTGPLASLAKARRHVWKNSELCSRRLLARYSSQSFVKGDYRHIDIFFAFGYRIFGLQLGPLGIQQRKKINHSFAVAQTSDVGGTLALASLIVQFDESCLLCMALRECRFRFLTCSEHGVFIESHRFFVTAPQPPAATPRPP